MKTEWKSYMRFGIICFLLYLAIHYWSTVSGIAVNLLHAANALLVGAIIAYLLNILMSWYERLYFPKSTSSAVVKSRRVVCMLASMITLIGIVLLLIRLVLPELLACVSLLVAEVPKSLYYLIDWIQESGFSDSAAANELMSVLEGINWQEKVQQMVRLLLEGMGGAALAAISTLTTLFSTVVTMVISTIFAIYLLAGKEHLTGQFNRVMDCYLPVRWNQKIRYTLSVLNSSFHNFIVGQCTEAVVLGLLCMTGMTLLKFPYAVMIGSLIGFTALIPVAGAYMGASVGAFMILTVSPMKALGFLVFIVVLQQLEDNLIYPKVVGNSIGLPGVWVLASITVGGGLFGMPGMLIGVPLTAAIYQLIRTDMHRRLDARKPGTDSES